MRDNIFSESKAFMTPHAIEIFMVLLLVVGPLVSVKIRFCRSFELALFTFMLLDFKMYLLGVTIDFSNCTGRIVTDQAFHISTLLMNQNGISCIQMCGFGMLPQNCWSAKDCRTPYTRNPQNSHERVERVLSADLGQQIVLDTFHIAAFYCGHTSICGV